MIFSDIFLNHSSPKSDFSTIPPIRDVFFLTGATASGKTRLGIELAEKRNAEILSMDSMAVYRKMDIGTAKPSSEEQKGIPHHLIDLVGPDQEFSLAEYLRIAAQKVTEVRGRGKLPLFVGGTPLYLKGLLRGIFEGPPADEPFRSRLRAIEQQHGVGTLHAELMKFDPVTAARLHPNDQKRIIRALEVLEKTGTPISRLQTQFDVISPSNRPRVFVLDWERETLYRRINERVDLMMKQGFLEEVQHLFDSGVALAKTASQAVGYCELGNYLKGEVSLTDAVEQIKQRTRRFAKHQETWFRSLAECHFIPVTEETSLDELRMAIEKLMF